MSAQDRDGTFIAYETATWSSSDPSVASVSITGLVTAKNEGRAIIVANIGGVSGQSVVTVEWSKSTAIVIRPTTDLVFASPGETWQLSATVLDRQGRVLENVPVTWSSSDSSIVAVDSLGVITLTGRGSAQITAKAGDASATKEINVSPGRIRGVLSHDSITLKRGETYQLGVKFVNEDGGLYRHSVRAFGSSDAAVATVDTSGMIIATGIGRATINIATGIWQFTSRLELTYTVEVVVVPASGIVVLTRRDVLLTPGDEQRIDIRLGDIELYKIRTLFPWYSSNPAVATVDSTGIVTAVSAGTTTIRVERAFTSHDEVISGEVEVRVVPEDENLILSPSSPLLTLNDRLQLSARFEFDASITIPDLQLYWYSFNRDVVDVDSTGLITAIRYGDTAISARDYYGNYAFRGRMKVVVAPIGGTVTLTVREDPWYPGEGRIPVVRLDGKERTWLTPTLFTWTSSDSTVATVDSSGRVTAVSAGTTTIRAERAFTLHDAVISGELKIRVVSDG